MDSLAERVMEKETLDEQEIYEGAGIQRPTTASAAELAGQRPESTHAGLTDENAIGSGRPLQLQSPAGSKDAQAKPLNELLKAGNGRAFYEYDPGDS